MVVSLILALFTIRPEARRAMVDWITFGIGSADRGTAHDVPEDVSVDPKP